MYFKNKHYGRRTWGALIVIVVGCAMTTYQNAEFHTLGFCFALASTAAVSSVSWHGSGECTVLLEMRDCAQEETGDGTVTSTEPRDLGEWSTNLMAGT